VEEERKRLEKLQENRREYQRQLDESVQDI
jgi:hypothetical protein